MRIYPVLLSAATWCVLSSRAEPPISTYLPSGYSTMNQHSFAPPSASSFSSFSSPTSYSAPAYTAPAKLYGPPKKSYLPSKLFSVPSHKYGIPSSSYGAPSSKGYDDYHHHEPAHYEFHYDVHDPHHGTEFGHKESRNGDVAKGQYMVLLPDGRRQIVDYIADSHGYRPTIRYEGGHHYDKIGYR